MARYEERLATADNAEPGRTLAPPASAEPLLSGPEPRAASGRCNAHGRPRPAFWTKPDEGLAGTVQIDPGINMTALEPHADIGSRPFHDSGPWAGFSACSAGG